MTLATLVVIPSLTAQAADISWLGSTASYTNAANWVSGVVPGSGDNAVNDTGSNNVVQINAGNPNWTVNDIRAGNGAGNGAYEQNGQILTLNGWFRLGIAAADTGVFTLNSGTINYQGNHFSIGELGTGIMNVNGGAINGSGNFAVNLGAVNDGSGALNPNTCVLNQSAGAINVTGGGQLFVGNRGTGVYNLSGGTMDVHNYIAFGRSSGSGTVNMTGGTLNQDGGGNLLVGSGYQNNGSPAVGVLNQSGGTINSQGRFFCPENAPSSGTYNLSSPGVLNVQSEMVIGRGGAAGVMTMTGGTVTKTGGDNFIVGADNGTVGTLNQSGGSIDVNNETWIGQAGGASGSYNLSGGAFTARSWFVVGRGGSTGVLNLTNGSITKLNSGNNLIIADGGGSVGTLNQYGGSITNTASGTWVGNGGGNGTWNFNGGSAVLGVVNIINGGGTSSKLNLNGGVMTLQELKTGNSGAISQLTLNGGTLRASADSANFLHDITLVNVSAPGGAIFDSQGYNITISQALPTAVTGGDGSGGLIKNGSGTLTLIGANSYSGPTVLNAGKLVINTAGATGGGDYTVANGADLNLTVSSANGQLNAANLTLSGSPAATLDVDLGSFGNPTSAPLNVSGTLAVSGVITVNIADGAPQIGQFPLITYGTPSISGSFVLGSLPIGVGAYISNNVGSIDLVITNAIIPRWEGLAGGNWDIGVTTNWINIGTGLPVVYGQGNAVVFDDQAQGTTTVNLVTNVSPVTVVFKNDTASYTLVGTGKISGTTGITKQGTGTVSIANSSSNNYTGPTVISGGVLAVTNLANGGTPSAIGASSASAANLVLAGGALSYSGPAVTINRGYSTQQTNSSIITVSNLTLSGVSSATLAGGLVKSGDAQLTYTTVGSNTLSGAGSPGYVVQAGSVLFDGSSGGQTNQIGNGLSVVGATGNASVIMTNTTVTTTSDLSLGNVPNTTGSLIINNGTTLNVGSWFTFGDSANSVGTCTLNAGTLNVPNGRLFLCSAPGTMSTFNINGGVINKAGDYFAVVNGGWNGAGARTGVVNQVAGTVNSSSELWIGDAGGAGNGVSATYNLSGGSLNLSNWFGVGRNANGTFAMTGGTINKSGNGIVIGTGGGVAQFDQSAGTINSSSEYWVAENNGTIATNNISGTAAVNVSTYVTVGRAGLGVVNMSGGSFTQTGGNPFFVGIYGGGHGIWNQSGGALSISATLHLGDTDQGDFNLSGGSANAAGQVWIAQGGGAVGTMTISGGAFTNNSWLAVGREDGHGTLNIYGGTMVKTGDGNISIAHGIGDQSVIPSGIVNQSGGTFICATGETWIGEDSGPGIWNMSGGTAKMGVVHLAQNANAQGTLNLLAGVFAASEVTSISAGTSTLNFDGGTLAATVNNANFLYNLTAANVNAGGAIIDSGANVISIAQALLGNGSTGGLTKLVAAHCI